MDNNTKKFGQDNQAGLPSQEKEGLLHKVGDVIEKVGDKVGQKVSESAGEAIRKLGDKIEHAGDKH